MKKLLFIAVIAISGMLFGCNNSSAVAGEEVVVPSEIKMDLKKVTVYVGEPFNVLTGVVGTDETGKALPCEFVYSAGDEAGDIVDENGMLDTSVPGKYTFLYRATYEGLSATASRVINVFASDYEEPEYYTGEDSYFKSNDDGLGENLITNGSFDSNTSGWEIGTYDGGTANLSFSNGMAKVQITGVNWNGQSGSPKLVNTAETPFAVTQGTVYKVSFKAKSDTTRTIMMQVGQILTADPWWTDIKGGEFVYFRLTKELKEYSFYFTATRTNSFASLCFEMGNVIGDKALATCYFDDIAVQQFNGVVSDSEAPVISVGNENVEYFVGKSGTLNPTVGVSVNDNIDGNLKANLKYEVYKNGVLTEDPITYGEQAVYKIVYSVSDLSGNYAEKVKTISVVSEPSVAINEELIENGDFSQGSSYFLGGGSGTALNSVKGVDGMLQAACSPVNSIVSYAEHLTFTKNSYYIMSFDCKATSFANLGVSFLIDGNSTAFTTKTLSISPNMESYNVLFKYSGNSTDEGIMRFGLYSNITYLFDNISLKRIEAQNVTAATLSGIGKVNVALNDEFDPLDGVTATHSAIDVTENITYKIYDWDGNVIEYIDTTSDNTYLVRYNIVTTSTLGYITRVTRRVVIGEGFEPGSGVITTWPASTGISVSAVTASTGTGSDASDNNLATRWESTQANNQWITFDLGSEKSFRSIYLSWEAAYASNYNIQISSDGETWTTVYTNTSATGGMSYVSFSAKTARYVKINCVTRATNYGFSLWEVKIVK